jgi:hypothetical protein
MRGSADGLDAPLRRSGGAGAGGSPAAADPPVKRALSSQHCSLDGTRIEARASMKGFRPKDGSAAPPGPGRTGERDVHGATRRNATHASTSAPEARLRGSRTARHRSSALAGMW